MQKDNTISYMRVIAMLLVVLGHAFAIYSSTVNWPFEKSITWYWTDACKIIYAIHMPVFFIISGFLYSHLYTYNNKYKDAQKFIIGKIKRLIIPYIFWTAVQALIFKDYLAQDTIYNGGYHLWFLLALFWQFVIFTLIRKIWNKISLRIQLIVLVLLISAINIGHLSDYLPNVVCLKATLRYIPYFYWGIIMGLIPKSYYSKRESIIVVNWRVGTILAYNLLSTLIFVTIALILPVDHYGSLYSIVLTLSIMIFVTTSYLILQGKEVQNQRVKRIVTSLDKCSMGIYILHHIMIWLILDNSFALICIERHSIYGVILLFIVSLLASWILTSVISKIKHTKYIIG